MSALSPRVAFLDHQRLLLNVDNSAIKQRIAALAQDKIFKDGTYYSIILLFLQPYIFIYWFIIIQIIMDYIFIYVLSSHVYIFITTCNLQHASFFSFLYFIPQVATWFFCIIFRSTQFPFVLGHLFFWYWNSLYTVFNYTMNAIKLP